MSETSSVRIRTIKPDFFVHDGLAALAPLTRLLFIGLWCLADRDGRLQDRPARIKVEVLPYDNIDAAKALDELHAAGFIIRYSSNGHDLISIPTFRSHQRLSGKELETPSRFPCPSEEDIEKHSRSVREVPEKHPGAQEGKGREGKGNIAPASPARDLVFEALVTFEGSKLSDLTSSARGRINLARKELKAVQNGMNDEVFAVEIGRRGDNLRKMMPKVIHTSRSLSTHWAESGNGVTNANLDAVQAEATEKLRKQIAETQEYERRHPELYGNSGTPTPG